MAQRAFIFYYFGQRHEFYVDQMSQIGITPMKTFATMPAKADAELCD